MSGKIKYDAYVTVVSRKTHCVEVMATSKEAAKTAAKLCVEEWDPNIVGEDQAEVVRVIEDCVLHGDDEVVCEDSDVEVSKGARYV
mgnify:CR=1 FL=1